MRILQEIEKCTGCGACNNICPKSCVSMINDQQGFRYPVINEKQCIQCGSCIKVCPLLKEDLKTESYTSAVAARCLDKSVQALSSSGGFFHYISKWILEKGGVVYGASWDEDFHVVHVKCENEKELHRIYRAKYTQSYLGDCFKDIQIELKKGRYVLFSGTPCQAAAVKSYLGKPYPRFYLVDIVCHGVPSPEVWKRYVRYRAEKDNNGVMPVSIDMRDKSTGWPSFSVRFAYSDSCHYMRMKEYDPYMRVFVHNLCLRKSCYNCSFKGIDRPSDFTLGDYWGIWDQMPDFDDHAGTSIVLFHTGKARELWEKISNNFEAREIDPSLGASGNPAVEYSSPMNPQRESFMSRVFNEDFELLADELAPIPVRKRVGLLKRCLAKAKRTVKYLLIYFDI